MAPLSKEQYQFVPVFIINERHLISGGQAPEVFEQTLRQIIASN